MAGAVVWLTHPEPDRCEAAPAVTQPPTSPPMLAPPVATQASPLPTVEPQPVVAGEARYYAFSSGVACSYEPLPLDGFYVGMSTPEYGRAEPCGAVLDIHGPRGDVRALVVDRCPGCAPGQLDLSTAAYDQIADRHDGVAKITYSVVRNPDPPPELHYEVKPDASPEWFAILFTGTGNPLREAAIRPADGGPWQDLTRGMDNYWTVSGAGGGPFAARVTDIHGNQAEVFGISLEPGLRPTGAHLYLVPPPPTSSLAPITSPSSFAAAPKPQPGVTRPTGCR
ncbi:expansin EXLX1 family cellulose-binding protein [Nocardia sp. NPDC052566]|uniref:expansin EXLX1 family cellulose-binding protein n=1 Tax=Nocardia sp. NPDC052566 TaxID=3364330 RepID=UPI0037C77D84